MPRYDGFASVGGEAQNAIQQFLVQRQLQMLQQQQEQRAQQEQVQRASEQAAQLKLQQQQEARIAAEQQAQEARLTRTERTQNAGITVGGLRPGPIASSMAPGILAQVQGTPYASRFETQDTLPARFGDPMQPQESGSESFTSMSPTPVQEQAQGKQAAQAKLVELIQSGAPRDQILAAMAGAGENIGIAALNDPNQARNTAINLENLRNTNELGQIAARGAEDRRTLGAPRPAPQTPPRQPDDAERKNAGFYSQMEQAITNLDALEPTLTEQDIYQIQSLPQEGVLGAMNRNHMSENAKRYVQAFNQFTEARLRPVSGAMINADEYARDRATYGKQYGETTDLSAQRTQARDRALSSLRGMAGNAIPAGGGGHQIGEKKTFPNGRTATWDGKGWAAD